MERVAATPPTLLGAALLLCLLPLAAADGEAAGESSVDVGSCQSPVWKNLPLAKNSVPSDEYDPTSREYYSDWVVKNVLPPFVFACIAAALLTAFMLWRLARTFTCVACLRGPRLRGKPAADLLGARCMRWLRWGVALLAAGMVAGAGFGFSTIEPSLEPAGIEVYEQTKAYVAGCVAQANSTVGALVEMHGHVSFLRQRVLDLNLEQLQPGVLETIDGFHSDATSATKGMQAAVMDVQHAVLDHMEREQEEWQPRLDKLDVLKNAALYTAYVLIIISALAVALGVALSCPGLVKGSLWLLLFMILLAWAAVWASTAGLQVGDDGCAVVEQKVTDALVRAAERQVTTGEGILALVGVGDTLALSRYYFYGIGKNATEVLSDLTGLNIPRLLGAANQTVARLQQASTLLKGVNNTSVSTLPENLDTLAASIGQLFANISLLEGELSHARFHPVYLTVKQYGCCELLNFVGGLWLGLLVVGCCGLPLTLAVFVWLGRMDKLEPRGCCHVYRRSDFMQQTGPAVPELPGKKPGGLAGVGDSISDSDSEGESSPGRSPGGARLSLRSKFASAGMLRAGNGASGSGRLPAQADASSDAPDTFRISTAAYAPAARLDGEQRDPQDPPSSSPPSAPALPLSARSLGSARRASGGPPHFGTWAAAGAPPSARGGAAAGSRSAPGSTLNSARSTSALLPAVEALSPRAQAALPSHLSSSDGTVTAAAAGLHSSSSGGDLEQQQQQAAEAAASSSGSGSGSALKRAGNALFRLKLLRRK